MVSAAADQRRFGGLALAGVLVLTACGGGETPAPAASAAAASPSPSASATPDPMAAPSVDGKFATGDGDRRLAVRCWGTGSPTVIYDAGTGDTGIGTAESSDVFKRLAAKTRVCSYDRAGIGDSDPAPLRKRNLDDIVRDLDEALASAGVRAPYLMVGSSGGGFDVYHHAGRHPRDVVGLVMLDVPAGQANIPPGDIPAWDSPDNPERVDYVAVERQMALRRLPIPRIPVTVVTATDGQSADPEEQRVWLEGSSHPVQVVLHGGHDILDKDPSGVLAEIEKMLAVV